jgi:8-oxo-dGTP pyrophosphatase MutT (NUDIX family)
MLPADDALRQRLATNLAAFPRVALPLDGRRHAAVAAVVAAAASGCAVFVVTRRAAKMREHAGQWALPGGRIEPTETPEGAALRELDEELGVTLGPAHVLGLLDDYATRSGYVITPVVLWSAEPLALRPDPGEVAAAYQVELTALGRPEVPRLARIPESDRPLLQVPIAELDTAIHAPTAAILFQLWEVAVQGRSTRVAHFEQPTFAWK